VDRLEEMKRACLIIKRQLGASKKQIEILEKSLNKMIEEERYGSNSSASFSGIDISTGSRYNSQENFKKKNI